ncbi:MAG TPA: heme exporter protein CcmB [Polyangiaceae bacterium]|jgi:heme exporter protein B
MGVPFVRAALVVAAKDLRIEMRTREVTATTGYFAVLVAILASLSYTAGPKTTERVAPGTIWLSLAFTAVLAIGRFWQREREDGAFLALRTAPIARAAIFAGKAIVLLVFLLIVEIIVIPIVALVFHIDLPQVIVPLALVMLAGTIGVAATGTLFGAMTVRTRARDLMLAVVLFPLLAPCLLAGVSATREILVGAELSELSDYFVLFGLFDFVALAGGLGLFGTLIED